MQPTEVAVKKIESFSVLYVFRDDKLSEVFLFSFRDTPEPRKLNPDKNTDREPLCQLFFMSSKTSALLVEYGKLLEHDLLVFLSANEKRAKTVPNFDSARLFSKLTAVDFALFFLLAYILSAKIFQYGEYLFVAVLNTCKVSAHDKSV